MAEMPRHRPDGDIRPAGASRAFRSLFCQTLQIMDELLSHPTGEAAVAHLPGGCHGQQLLFIHVDALPGRQGQDDGLIFPGRGGAVVDGHTEPGGEGHLLLHRVGAVDVAVVLHVRAVVPGLPDEVTAVGGGIDQHIAGPGLHAALDDGL